MSKETPSNTTLRDPHIRKAIAHLEEKVAGEPVTVTIGNIWAGTAYDGTLGYCADVLVQRQDENSSVIYEGVQRYPSAIIEEIISKS